MIYTVTAYMGVIGSGKDYNSNRLAEKNPLVKRIDFKDALLEMVSDIAGYDVRLDYDWFKDHPVGVMRPSNPLMEAFVHSEWKDILAKHPEIITGRKLLTRVGTEAIRKRHPNYWVDEFTGRATKAIEDGGVVANADCRFLNEVARTLTYKNPRFVFCNYKSGRYNPKLDHASERLAQALLAMGFDDGDNIAPEFFADAANISKLKLMGVQ